MRVDEVDEVDEGWGLFGILNVLKCNVCLPDDIGDEGNADGCWIREKYGNSHWATPARRLDLICVLESLLALLSLGRNAVFCRQQTNSSTTGPILSNFAASAPALCTYATSTLTS
ncbi:MAG TPA: hypothetical protein PK971_03765, partial [Saprospiraceae bacterium]|nr:hypothetical protein [Saprospiraceae bacterium]